MKNYMYLKGGPVFDLDNPFGHIFDIETIAHSLANQCRFNGHTRYFYSVAEHSVRVASYLHHNGYNPHTCLAGLLHDAGEAITGDVIRPLQKMFNVDEIKNYEEVIHTIICAQAGLSVNLVDNKIIRQVDNVITDCEINDLIYGRVILPSVPLTFYFEGWAPETAKKEFLDYFNKYKKAVFDDLS